ncbi:MAG: glutamine-hydrolyzing GMP synthase, partial [Firmicutes bacterium]|nr:glutamine-hydrolyzing GMP synthase [Bacillota bacterium]
MENEKILVLDFGGQYNQLIARRVRDEHVYAEVLPYTTPLDEIKAGRYKGIIFTGGPNSVYEEASPHYTPEILDLGIPILGICYGAQLMAWMLGGTIEHAPGREYGRTQVTADRNSLLFRNIPAVSTVWMSHTDYVKEVPAGFVVTASSDSCPVAAMENRAHRLYAVQFHPEVTHSVYGQQILSNFLFEVCG